MRTCQSIFAILLAMTCISCQSAQQSPVGVAEPSSVHAGRAAQPAFASEAASKAATIDELASQAKKNREAGAKKVSTETEAKPPGKSAYQPKPVITPVRSGLLSYPTEVPTAMTQPPQSGRQHIVLNFDKADIAEVTSQIFGDQLKVNYVLDQTLQGRISMYIEGDYNNAEILRMVMRAYEANGISVIPRKGFYFIQLSQKTGGAGLPVANEQLLQGTGARPLIVIYRLRFMDAKQASDLITPFLTPGRRVSIDPITNSLVFVEQANNALILVNLLKTVDINVLREVSMEVVPLHTISPQDAVTGMKSLMDQLGKLKQTAVENSLALLPLDNFGGVLIMARNPELLRTARQWLKALDVQGVGNQQQIYVYFVQNGLAHDIAQILSEVLGISSGAAAKGQKIVPSGTAARSAFGGTSTSGGSGPFGSSPFGAAGSSGLGGTPGSTSGGLAGGSYMGGAPKTTGTGGGGIGAAASGRPPGFTGQVMIIPDEVNNAVVIRANPVDYAKLKKTIETLDIVPRAVLIEVMIAEVQLTKEFQFGLQYYFQSNTKNNTGIGLSFGGLSNQTTTTNTSGSAISSTANAFPINIGQVAGAGLGLSWVASAQNLAVLLSALSTKTRVTVLSTPTLLATDNQEATITVGGEEPVPTGSVTGYTTGSSVISTIDYAETGVILDITPHINAGGLVRLDLEQTVRRVNTTTTTVGNGNVAPTFTERHIKTNILAQDGRTVVIGGMIDSTGTEGKAGIPWLQNIPLLSPLFASRNSNLNRTELLIAITPHVIEKAGTQAPAELLEKLRDLRRRIGQ